MKIFKVIKYTKDDKEYAEKTRLIRQEAIESNELSAKSNQKVNIVPIDDDGDYYEFTSTNGKYAEMLQTGSLKYYSRVFVVPTTSQNSNVTFTPVYSQTGPRFSYLTTNASGSILGSSDLIHNQQSWWKCVQDEFYSMCLSSPWRALVCGAAGGAAPEMLLLIYASWMLSCAW
ncbi:MAG TPA: hypothetical protein VFW11_10855 [Cyclobacteriaceae bacterium]|nr:hypothetical protein [Cyclobacteriaceae bacterium]